MVDAEIGPALSMFSPPRAVFNKKIVADSCENVKSLRAKLLRTPWG